MSGAAGRPVVAFVTDAVFPYHRGGKEIRYHEIARRFADRAEVHVYTMNWWHGGRVHHEPGVTFHAIAPLLPLYAGERRSIKQAVVFALACLSLVFRRFDVIEADHMPYMQLFSLRVVATLRRKRLVATWHECWGPEYWREYLGRPGAFGWWFERLAMRLPDEIIAASSQTADRLRAQLGEDAAVTTAPNGVDLALIAEAPVAAEPTDLVVVGRLLDHKRIDLLVDAVAVLHAQGLRVSCRVIGDGPQASALRARTDDLGLTEWIDFRHDVAGQRELYSLLKAARVFSFPSAREGFGIAVLEAFACGLPVVATSARHNMAQHLVVRSPRGLVTEPTAEAFAHGIRSMLESAPGASAGEAWLGEYDWDSVTDRIAGVVLR